MHPGEYAREAVKHKFDVAVSDGRKIDKNGRCKKPVGKSVDVQQATWTNNIGEPELITVWKDPDFDPNVKACYYVRVIEIPTPGWSASGNKYFNLNSSEIPMITQERTYTSPIWFAP